MSERHPPKAAAGTDVMTTGQAPQAAAGPPPADPALLALANRALVEQLREARAEIAAPQAGE